MYLVRVLVGQGAEEVEQASDAPVDRKDLWHCVEPGTLLPLLKVCYVLFAFAGCSWIFCKLCAIT